MDRHDLQSYADFRGRLRKRAEQYLEEEVSKSALLNNVVPTEDGDHVCIYFSYPQCGTEGVSVASDIFLELTEES